MHTCIICVCLYWVYNMWCISIFSVCETWFYLLWESERYVYVRLCKKGRLKIVSPRILCFFLCTRDGRDSRDQRTRNCKWYAIKSDMQCDHIHRNPWSLECNADWIFAIIITENISSFLSLSPSLMRWHIKPYADFVHAHFFPMYVLTHNISIQLHELKQTKKLYLVCPVHNILACVYIYVYVIETGTTSWSNTHIYILILLHMLFINTHR